MKDEGWENADLGGVDGGEGKEGMGFE